MKQQENQWEGSRTLVGWMRSQRAHECLLGTTVRVMMMMMSEKHCERTESHTINAELLVRCGSQCNLRQINHETIRHLLYLFEKVTLVLFLNTYYYDYYCHHGQRGDLWVDGFYSLLVVLHMISTRDVYKDRLVTIEPCATIVEALKATTEPDPVSRRPLSYFAIGGWSFRILFNVCMTPKCIGFLISQRRRMGNAEMNSSLRRMIGVCIDRKLCKIRWVFAFQLEYRLQVTIIRSSKGWDLPFIISIIPLAIFFPHLVAGATKSSIVLEQSTFSNTSSV